jgi:molecular chaperone GrpE (heat shock protein)
MKFPLAITLLFFSLTGCIDFVADTKPRRDVVDPKTYNPWGKPEISSERQELERQMQREKKQEGETPQEYRNRREREKKEQEKIDKDDKDMPVKVVVPI